jgi:hypothetical protein
LLYWLHFEHANIVDNYADVIAQQLSVQFGIRFTIGFAEIEVNYHHIAVLFALAAVVLGTSI